MTSARPAPLRIGSTIAHLVALGTTGWIGFTILVTLIATGLGMLFVAGIGLFLLAAAVYVCFALAWIETARVAGLYRLSVPLPYFAKATKSGFLGWITSLGHQLRSGVMWRGLANATLGLILGTMVTVIMVGATERFVRYYIAKQVTGPEFFFGLLAVPEHLRPFMTPIMILASLAAVIGITLLHRTLSIAIISGGSHAAQLSHEVQRTDAQRRGAVRAAEVDRTRIERDLHDGIQPRLVSIAMTLGLAQSQVEHEPEAVKELISEAHTSTKTAITELRQLARGIHPSVLDDRGLDAALSALVASSHVPVELDLQIEHHLDPALARTAYFVIAEALTNVAKHSRASTCDITVVAPCQGPEGPRLWARIEDNGIGGALIAPSGGLDGIRNRVAGVGGSFTLTSPAGGPTTLEVNLS